MTKDPHLYCSMCLDLGLRDLFKWAPEGWPALAGTCSLRSLSSKMLPEGRIRLLLMVQAILGHASLGTCFLGGFITHVPVPLSNEINTLLPYPVLDWHVISEYAPLNCIWFTCKCSDLNGNGNMDFMTLRGVLSLHILGVYFLWGQDGI